MHTIALFGEAQKGEFQRGYFCTNLADLSGHFGEPPSRESLGLQFAIQALLYQRGVIFFRVREEGFSTKDYLKGLNLLEQPEFKGNLSAICLPGVGNSEIIEATTPVCQLHGSFLIVTQRDLYDYLTDRPN